MKTPLLLAVLLGASDAHADATVRTLAAHDLPRADAARLTALSVDYAPGAASHAHRHDAFAFVYVVAGRVRSRVEGEAEHVYAAGESWIERPGAHHVVSANASEREPARLLVVFVGDPAARLSQADRDPP